MSKKKRFLYILSTILLCFVITYACFTGCNLDVPEGEATEDVV